MSTDLALPRGPKLVLGTAQFDATYGVLRDKTRILDTCLLLAVAEGHGIRTLDTAPAYADAQEKIGRCGWRGSVHTKIPGNVSAPDSLRDSLRQLGLSSVEVAYFHDSKVLQEEKSFFNHIHSRVVPTLAEHLGVSIYTPQEFDTALRNPFISAIQAPINIVDHRISDNQLNEARRTGKEVYARSIFLQGTLLQSSDSLPAFLSKLVPVIQRLDRVGVDTGVTRLEILTQAALGRPGISGVVVGAESPDQLEGITSAFAAPRLPPELETLAHSLRVDDVDTIDPRRWPRK